MLNPLLELMYAAAVSNPGRTAIAFPDGGTSYEQLLSSAARIGQVLVADHRSGACVAVIAKRSLPGYAAIWGILAAGDVYMPLSLQDPPPRLAAKIDMAGAEIIVADAASLAQVKSVLAHAPRVRLLVVPDADAADIERQALDPRVTVFGPDQLPDAPLYASIVRPRQSADVAYLLFTSGSTGEPKGVRVTLGSVRAYVATMLVRLGMTADDRCSQVFDPSFDLALHDVLVCASAGATLVPIQGNALHFLDDVERHRITVWFSVPSYISLAAKSGQLKEGRLDSLRLSLFCGEALLARDAELWQRTARHSKICNLYGPTEATIAVSLHDFVPGQDDAGVVPIGSPFGENRFHVLDPQSGAPVAHPEHEGELAIAGPQLAVDYWQDPLRTAERFPVLDGPPPARVYRTGDRVRQENGVYLFLGRIDSEVKINGYRVNPLEVEGLLTEHLQAGVVAVVSRAPGRLAPIELVAFLLLGVMTAAAAGECARRHLPSYMMPAQFIELDEFPRLPNGKLDRKRLASAAAAGQFSQSQ